jgi:predicted Zn finger-like uncharacterized protein|tara:strand:- start:681 stop:1136 length:456 start_codon:yes stop_codon:yes gene_type:complete
MIIECINCNKKFEVNSDLIPSSGRTIQCGSCNHVWFFDKKETENLKLNFEKSKSTQKIKEDKNIDIIIPKKSKKIDSSKSSKIIKYEKKSNLSFSKFLSYLIVIIISFIGLIIIIDTFKSPLYNIFPKLEFLLYNLFETLKDIKLFIKDLI